MAGDRARWGSRLGFILAAAGSAVGLGNIWKFPYMAGQNGGGAFLVVYLILVFSVGISVMLAEFAIGRAAERNPVGAFAKLKGGAWPAVGYLGVAAGFIILSFYSVVAGWTIAYIVKTATGLLATSDPTVLGGIFAGFIADPVEPVIYHAVFMALTVGVVAGGVMGGIERACKILLPALFVILLILVVRAVTVPGAAAGIAFFLDFDFTKIDARVINAALGQAFFSLSLGLGVPLSLALGIWKGFTVAGKNLFDLMDYIASNLMLPIGGICITLFVGWVIYPIAVEEATRGARHGFALAPVWRIICQYVAPAAIVWILISGL